MAFNPKYTDRNGQANDMIQRKIRLTEEENEKLNELLKHTEYTLRDLIAEMIEERWLEEFSK